LLTESLLVSLAGGALGTALAWWGVRSMRDAIPANFAAFLPGWARMSIDPHVLLFALGAAMLTPVAFALLPVVRATRVDLSDVLKEGGRGSVGGVHGTRTRATLIVFEVSIALVLLTAATLFTRSVRTLRCRHTKAIRRTSISSGDSMRGCAPSLVFVPLAWGRRRRSATTSAESRSQSPVARPSPMGDHSMGSDNR
jgi:hypothetical protein